MSAPAAVPQTTQQTSLEDEIQSGDELNQSIFTLSIAIDDSDERLGRIPSLDCTPATEHSLDGRISSECAGSPVLRGDPYRINAVNIASLSCEFDGSDFLGIAAEDYEDGAELADQQMKKWIGATKNMPNSGDDGLRPSSTPIHEDEPRSESPRIPVPIQRHDMIKAPPKISPWLKCVTEEEGYTFYYNTLTGESSWDNPEVPVERNQYIQEDAVAMGIEGERVGGAIAQLGSAMSPPPSLAPSSSTIKSHLELIPSPAVDDSVVATISPDMSTVQVEVKPSPSKTAAQFEEQLDSVSQPAWMADAKNLMKLLQKDSPLPPPPVWGAGASLAPPPSLETVCLTEYGSGLSHPLGIGMSPGSVSGAHGDMVTPIREGGDSDSVASVRSAGSRNHHKVTPGQISPAISAGGSKNSSGQSALHITAAACNVKALALLLDGGFDPDVLDAEGRTAMMLLCSAPDLAATVGAKKKSGTPTDRLACLDALIRHGADLDSADANGNTALHLCVLTGSRCAENEGSEGEASAALAVSCIGILIDSGADISITNAEGDSPLHLAAKLGQLEMMQVQHDFK